MTWPCGMRHAVPPRKWNGPLSRGAGYSPETGFSTSVSKGYLNNPKSALTLLQAVSRVGPAQAWHGSLAAGLCCDTSVAPASARQVGDRRKREAKSWAATHYSLAQVPILDFLCCRYQSSMSPDVLWFDRHSAAASCLPAHPSKTLDGCFVLRDGWGRAASAGSAHSLLMLKGCFASGSHCKTYPAWLPNKTHPTLSVLTSVATSGGLLLPLQKKKPYWR